MPLWEMEGMPEGEELRHWEQASREIASEQGLEQEQGFAPDEPEADMQTTADGATETEAPATNPPARD